MPLKEEKLNFGLQFQKNTVHHDGEDMTAVGKTQ